MRSRNFMLTFWKKPSIKEEMFDTKLQYIIYQKEKCPETKKIHWQGYAEFKDKVSFKQIKELFKDDTVHIEPRRGTQQQAVDYCSKEKSRVGDTVERGIKKFQGKRSDIDEIWDDINDDCTVKEILEKHKGNALRMIHCIERGAMIKHGFSTLDEYIIEKRKRGTSEDSFDSMVKEAELKKKLSEKQ